MGLWSVACTLAVTGTGGPVKNVGILLSHVEQGLKGRLNQPTTSERLYSLAHLFSLTINTSREVFRKGRSEGSGWREGSIFEYIYIYIEHFWYIFGTSRAVVARVLVESADDSESAGRGPWPGCPGQGAHLALVQQLLEGLYASHGGGHGLVIQAHDLHA
eukprot:9487461-Pyramimonas_sp.AAC.1